jgi:hypothetical protein
MSFRTSPVVAEGEWQLRLEVQDAVCVLTLDRPDKLNAWSWLRRDFVMPEFTPVAEQLSGVLRRP